MNLETEIEGQTVRFESSPKWVRVMFGGQIVADSKNAHLLLPGGPPYYFFPKEDVHQEFLIPSIDAPSSDDLAKLSFFDLKVGNSKVEQAAWHYDEPIGDMDITDFVAFHWDDMDAWFEEGEQVYVHPHDPYKRIDIRHSNHHIEIIIGGQKVAESNNPSLLFETGLPIRYYLPPLDVNYQYLKPSNTTTGCAYKGIANYYSVNVGDQEFPDIAWYYSFPLLEGLPIAGMIAFFNEKVDKIILNGIELPKPKTYWSPPESHTHVE